jgi:autotransporter passenger strand-loop-strand repeat protein
LAFDDIVTGVVSVASGGTNEDAFVSSGGTLIVAGSDIGTPIFGSNVIPYGTTISAGGTLILSSGYTESGLTLSSGAVLVLENGAAALPATETSGVTVIVHSSGATSSGGTTSSGGSTASGAVILTGAGADTVYFQTGGSFVQPQNVASSLVTTPTGQPANSNAIWLNGSQDTVALGDGSATVGEGGSHAVIFGGAGPALIALGGADDTVVAGAGAMTLFGGADDVVFGSPQHGSLLYLAAQNASPTIVGGNTPATVWGASGADVTFWSNQAGGALNGGGGNETLNAAGSPPANQFNLFTGAGANTTLVLGLGADTITLFDGHEGGNVSVYGFNASTTVDLAGFGAGAAAAALAGASVTRAGTIITLSDGTTVTFVNGGLSSNTVKSF